MLLARTGCAGACATATFAGALLCVSCPSERGHQQPGCLAPEGTKGPAVMVGRGRMFPLHQNDVSMSGLSHRAEVVLGNIIKKKGWR